MSLPARVTIDVISDVVCPWCYLGKRRLEQALAELPGVAAEIRWRPFQLDPTIPPEGIERAEYLRRKFGSLEALDGPHAHLNKAGAALGIPYAFNKITRSPNTINAHRLVRWAGEADVQDAVVEQLFRRYFVEGTDVGDVSVLANVAAAAGMDAGKVIADLATDRDRDAVQTEIAVAGRAGVTGVPCFVFNSAFGVMGAQPPEALVTAIKQALATDTTATS